MPRNYLQSNAIGLIALIDEATGYQLKRDSDELQKNTRSLYPS